MVAFCRAGNLSALLKDEKLPEPLRIYAKRLQALYEEDSPTRKKMSNSKLEPVGRDVLILLSRYLNAEGEDGCVWMLPDEWAQKEAVDLDGFAPIPPRAFYYKNIEHLEVTFSTFTANPNNSFIQFTAGSPPRKKFGRIYSIFVHRRSPEHGKNIFDTWLHVQTFANLPHGVYNPFSHVNAPNVQAHMCAWSPTQDLVIRLNDVESHCSWIMYRALELHRELKIPTVALVSMER